MAPTTVQEALNRLTELDPAKIKEINGVILFDLTGEGGGQWTLTLAEGKATLEPGSPSSPTVTLSMNAQDFLAMSRGELNPVGAFMQGKLKVTGDMGLAMKLQNVLG